MLNWLRRQRVAKKQPTPRPPGRYYVMRVEDLFTIRGRGVVVIGLLDPNFPTAIRVHDVVELVYPDGRQTDTATVSGLHACSDGLGLLLSLPKDKSQVPAGTQVWLTVKTTGTIHEQA